jgi:signal transduction histidine kinase
LNEGRIVGLQEKVRTFFRKWFMGVVGALRPRGPLANDTTARVLHWLLIALLGWYAVYLSIILPLVVVKKAAVSAPPLLGMIGWMVGLMLIRRGRLRAAALLYLTIFYFSATFVIVLLGGVHTTGMVLYLAMPISAAWLLGERAALVCAGVCLGTSLLLAILETAGISMPQYFPGTPMGFWVLLLAATVFSAAPVVLVLRILQEALAQARALSGRLLRLQDDEHRRLARELHDTTAQNLAALGMNLQIVQDEACSTLTADARQILSESMNLADQCIRELRTFSYLLHPPVLDDLGLGPALNWYTSGFARRSGVHVELLIPSKLERLPASVETAVFRVVQESLINIHRHSGSKVARIRLVSGRGELVLEVEDEGRASKASRSCWEPGLGIAGAEERLRELGGRLELDQTPSGGTIIRAMIPVRSAKLIQG